MTHPAAATPRPAATLRAATPGDFAFIRGLTTRADYAPFIGDADESQLAEWSESRSARVLIWEGATARGFAIFREIGDPSGRVELFRLALDRAGGGIGAAFLADLLDHGFGRLGARRIWLDASGENPRAMALYEAMGFRREGIQRAHWFRPLLGRAVDLHLFGLMRDEWRGGGS
ncbi:MAG: GNAT family N-acetyltransferase [Rhodobacteraceae bacterium]|jgi:RimJ/RimL family protein N-acetyltransferase|nr:GNAT family N-acetyltransferase [Paracoccaceae bacterium]